MAFTREDAEKKCMDLGGKQYLEVKWRMVWFREQCPAGTIDTEELAFDLDREVSVESFKWVDDPARSGKKKKETYTKTAKGYARYKAIVTDGNGARATGTKSECAANFPDYGEKAETGAIGRALAALGYGTQFTGDELDEGKRIVDSPVQTSKDQALHALTQPGSYEEHEQANGNQDTVAITRGDLYATGEAKGLWSRTSPEKFYAWARTISARPQSRTAWDMTIAEMGEMAKRIYAEPGITSGKKASAGAGR